MTADTHDPRNHGLFPSKSKNITSQISGTNTKEQASKPTKRSKPDSINSSNNFNSHKKRRLPETALRSKRDNSESSSGLSEPKHRSLPQPEPIFRHRHNHPAAIRRNNSMTDYCSDSDKSSKSHDSLFR